MKVKLCAIALLLAAPLASVGKTSSSGDLRSIEQKLHHIEMNGRSQHPDPAPTVCTEQEVNAYLASGNVVLPSGVQSVKLEGTPGVITGTTRVDFDRIREGVHSSNPLLSIFSGIHDVVVLAHGHGAGGKGYVHVDSVSIDGIEVPHLVLELFVEKFLQPKYPQIGIDSQFALPDRVDTAIVGSHELTVIQK